MLGCGHGSDLSSEGCPAETVATTLAERYALHDASLTGAVIDVRLARMVLP